LNNRPGLARLMPYSSARLKKAVPMIYPKQLLQTIGRNDTKNCWRNAMGAA